MAAFRAKREELGELMGQNFIIEKILPKSNRGTIP
jgi:hypothetical protein